eukprot:764797-Hanusia_phi.AAC.5
MSNSLTRVFSSCKADGLSGATLSSKKYVLPQPLLSSLWSSPTISTHSLSSDQSHPPDFPRERDHAAQCVGHALHFRVSLRSHRKGPLVPLLLLSSPCPCLPLAQLTSQQESSCTAISARNLTRRFSEPRG